MVKKCRDQLPGNVFPKSSFSPIFYIRKNPDFVKHSSRADEKLFYYQKSIFRTEITLKK